MSPLPLRFARRTLARSHLAQSDTHAASSPAIAAYSALPAPVVRPFPSKRRRPTLPVSLPLRRFATHDITPTPDPAHPCYDLAEFDLDNSRVVMSESPVSDVVSVVSFEMLSATSRLAPLSPQGSPVSTEVVESSVSDAAVVPSDMSSATCRFTPLNAQGSPMSTEVVDRSCGCGLGCGVASVRRRVCGGF